MTGREASIAISIPAIGLEVQTISRLVRRAFTTENTVASNHYRKYESKSSSSKSTTAASSKSSPSKSSTKKCKYYLEHGPMPDVAAACGIHEKLFQSVLSLAPKTLFEEFEAVCRERASKYEERIQADIASGVTLESLKEKKRKKTSEEKLEVQKKKNAERRKRRKKKKAEAAQQGFNSDQDDIFFFIAGYISGGAPYGITWEEMGMRAWQSLEDEKVEAMDVK